MLSTVKTSRLVSRLPFVTAGILLAILLIVLILELTGLTHIFHRQPSYPSTPTVNGGSVNEAKGESSSQSASSTDGSQPGDNKNDISGSSTILVSPSGNFVGAHHISTGTAITSVCNTTPGAQCTIQFTNDTVTKSLPTETADRGGAVYWNNWTPANIGLSAGTWQVKAIATLNGQTKTANDEMPLVVQE